MWGGGKMIKDFRKTIKLKTNKNGQFSFFVVDFLQLPHAVISNYDKLTHPNVQYSYWAAYTVFFETKLN